VLALSLLLNTFVAASSDILDAGQQALFLAAEKALGSGNETLFQQLKGVLRNYPLYPYLEYRQLKDSLASASAEEVEHFLQHNADTPLAPLLRKQWLNLLARRKQWQSYLEFYDPADGNVSRQCHYLNALLQTGRREEAFSRVEPLWLHGKSRPKACDPVFDAWRRAGQLTTELVWQRIALAMDKGKVKLVSYLKKQLPAKERPWADLWLQLRSKPKLALDHSRLRQPHPMRQSLLRYAAVRQAYRDPADAIDFWRQLQRQHEFTPLEKQRVEHKLAQQLVREDDPAAWRFLQQIAPDPHDIRLQEIRMRAALYRQQWHQVLAWIEELPEDSRLGERWRYWRARALEQTGDRKAANVLYESLAKERSFHGFLAADHIGAPYNLKQQPAPVDDALRSRVANEPGVQRARELVALERWTDARREWRFVTRHMSAEETMAAAKIAQSWGWHDQAIFTLARSGYWDDLELRFPLAHHQAVHTNARKHDLDISWVYGVIRQESAFNPSVRSHAGAMGLMQLMPATARHVARKLLKRKRSPHRRDLTNPKINIELGTTYLSNVLERLEQNPVLATAAYNAGPHRVSRWLPQQQLPADIWIELIPYRETRRYVERVFTYAVIYDHRRNEEIIRISQRLRPINGTSAQHTAQQQRNLRATL
jgi:soluble lytic murein transglycosylase